MHNLTRSEWERPVSDLAAALTEPALEVLVKSGVRGDSVAMELELWDALAEEIQREARWIRRAPDGELELGGVLEEVVHRAALQVAGSFAPGRDTGDLEFSIVPRIGALQLPAGLRSRLTRLAAPAPRDRRPLGNSGTARRLQLTALN
jgi:hypothetical protein